MNLFPSFCGVLLHSRLSFASIRRRSLDAVRIGAAVLWSIHPGHSQGTESRDKKQSYVWLALFLQYLTRADAHMAYDLSDETLEEEANPNSGPDIRDIFSFIGIAIMLVWPWIFFGVVWAKGGVQMNNHLANLVQNHPHTTTYFITFISSIISLIIGELFSLCVIRFAQELVTYRKPTQPFHLTVLLAFSRQTWPWGKSTRDVTYLMTKDRWWPAVSVILCALIFPHLTSSTATLLTPTSFNRTAVLTGTESLISHRLTPNVFPRLKIPCSVTIVLGK